MIISLGIETSCDDTSVSIISKDSDKINIVFIKTLTHKEKHQDKGGVIPFLASSCHTHCLGKLIEEALLCVPLKSINIISVTNGPGLSCSLLIGNTVAHTISTVSNIPIIHINHLEGHVFSSFLDTESTPITYPFLTLLFSGGHSQFILTKSLGKHIILSRTKDDALGECFDKVARMLGMKYPGGPYIERAAKRGDKEKFRFPRSMCRLNEKDMSFSGIKTSVRHTIEKYSGAKKKNMSKISYDVSKEFQEDISASFQEAIKDILIFKVKQTLSIIEKERVTCVNFVGGVASNQYLAKSLQKEIEPLCPFITPKTHLCCDNGAMIALAGSLYYEKNQNIRHTFASINPSWQIQEIML